MSIPTVQVAGLLVPAPLVPRIVAAVRGTYPTLADGLDDDASVRALLKHWIVTLLMAYEGAQAEAPLEGELAALRADYDARAEAARQKAADDAALIIENPTLGGTA